MNNPNEGNWTVCRRADLHPPTDSCKASPFSHQQDEGPWSGYEEALALYDAFNTCTDSYVATLIQDALRVLHHAYRLYGPESVICSYNGGKDACVIVHLLRAAHANFLRDRDQMTASNNESPPSTSPSSTPPPPKLIKPRMIYFEHADEFPEVEALLHDTCKRFDFNMVSFENGTGYADGLELLVETNCNAHPMAIVLGTRTGDPNAGSQGVWAPSSHFLPPFMRVNPVIGWTYGHVWHFLRLYGLPYCSLYDQGYTSLGTTKDTLPCPALAKSANVGLDNSPSTSTTKACVGCKPDCDGKGGKHCKYWPAYLLRDYDMERAGRIATKHPKKKIQHTLSESSSTATLSQKDPGSRRNSLNDGEAESDSESSSPAQKTVGLVVVGDEILKGQTADVNSYAAAFALRENNVPLARVSIVSDDLDEIADEIRRMQGLCDAVITSGGVGPTHDDVTIKSVAMALGDELVLHQEMAALLVDKMGDKAVDEQARMKMSTLPSTSRLRYLTDDLDEWPILQCGHNVFILPGVPQFFEAKVKALATHLLSSDLERSVFYRVVLSCEESAIVEPLNEAVLRHPSVSFGSYPFVDHPGCKTVLTLEGRLIEGGYTHTSGRFLKLTPAASSSASGENGEASHRQSLPPAPMLNTKKEMDLNVELALSDLLRCLPDGSVLRVEENIDSLYCE